METTKRILAMLLAILMVMGLATTAFAAGEEGDDVPGVTEGSGDEAPVTMEGTLTGGSITITNPEEEQTYSAYQILYLESYDATNNKYAYKANSNWATWLATQTTYVTIDAQGYVTWVDAGTADMTAEQKAEANAQKAADFAKLAMAQLAGKPVAATVTADADDETVTLSGLKLGYYLVDTTLGTLCSLDTTNPTANMQEKNEAPIIEKLVKEDSTGEMGETNDADFNQTITFESYITVKKGAENYIMHDKMSDGLTFKGYVRVYYYVPVIENGKVTYPGNREDVASSNYEVITNPSCGKACNCEDTCSCGGTCTSEADCKVRCGDACTFVENCTFDVKFDNEWISSLALETKIVVEYTAYLNHDAVVGSIGNPNDVWLQYGDENHPSYTPKDRTITYTGQLGIYKYTLNGTQKIALPGAEFELKLVNGQNLVDIRFHVIRDGNNNVVSYEVCHTDNTCTEEHTKTLVSTDDTEYKYNIKIEGLDAGAYKLIETKAPAGYNKLSEAVDITVPNVDEETLEKNYNIVRVEVENKSGTELPSTGGMGTTLFYVVGSVLVLAAVVLLVTKRRVNTSE